MKNKNKNFNEFRAKWDMPHATKKEYHRNKVKEESWYIIEEDLIELEQEVSGSLKQQQEEEENVSI